jgi:hypothetical protein
MNLQWESLLHFANSSFFFALITLAVGSSAIAIYVKQKQDSKRDAASLILQEIRYAEQKLRSFIPAYGFNLHDHILPSSSWHHNVHLFVNDLSEYEIDLISSFYTKCEYIDILIKKIADQRFLPFIFTPLPPPNQPLVPQIQVSNPPPLNPNPSGFPNIPQNSPSPPIGQMQMSQEANNYLHEMTTELKSDLILTSSVGERLRSITKQKKWKIL